MGELKRKKLWLHELTMKFQAPCVTRRREIGLETGLLSTRNGHTSHQVDGILDNREIPRLPRERVHRVAGSCNGNGVWLLATQLQLQAATGTPSAARCLVSLLPRFPLAFLVRSRATFYHDK